MSTHTRSKSAPANLSSALCASAIWICTRVPSPAPTPNHSRAACATRASSSTTVSVTRPSRYAARGARALSSSRGNEHAPPPRKSARTGSRAADDSAHGTNASAAASDAITLTYGKAGAVGSTPPAAREHLAALCTDAPRRSVRHSPAACERTRTSPSAKSSTPRAPDQRHADDGQSVGSARTPRAHIPDRSAASSAATESGAPMSGSAMAASARASTDC
mmetsp:Transcript_7543/g.23853  ORF Transcript_7543/g.23853 Transcript_7543/m.23853 type:complete len:220 (-) Transcript_7543:131-790(-)